MLEAGQAIPLALGAVTDNEAVWAAYAEEPPLSASQRQSPSRAYRDVAADAGVRLRPALHRADLHPGRWLVHTENGGKPTCIGLHIPTEHQCTVH